MLGQAVGSVFEGEVGGLAEEDELGRSGAVGGVELEGSLEEAAGGEATLVWETELRLAHTADQVLVRLRVAPGRQGREGLVEEQAQGPDVGLEGAVGTFPDLARR